MLCLLAMARYSDLACCAGEPLIDNYNLKEEFNIAHVHIPYIVLDTTRALKYSF